MALYAGVGAALAMLRRREGARPAEAVLQLPFWPMDWAMRCLAALHEDIAARSPGPAGGADLDRR